MRVKIFIVIICLVLWSGCFTNSTQVDSAQVGLQTNKTPFILPLEIIDLTKYSCENVKNPDLCKQELELLEKQNKYRQRKQLEYKRYQKIVDNSPIPVFVMDKEEFKINYLEKVKSKFAEKENLEYLTGMWVSRKHQILGWPNQFMFIEDNKNPDYMIGSFFHEKGHYLCYKNRCYCLLDSTGVLPEVHAIEYELEMLFAHKFYDALEMAYRSIAQVILKLDGTIDQEAGIIVSEGKLWKLVVEYLKEREKLNKGE